MKTTASDVLVETLLAWGVDTVFGIPGDGINGIIEAFRKRQDRIRFIQVRHEEAAAFAACGYAKFTGRLGVCVATSGPGGIHLLNGLYDAKLDGVPVLAITGLQFHDLLNTETQQNVELDRLFMDVCKYSNRIMGRAHVEDVVELACRAALAYRGVAHVTMPVDMQEMPADTLRSKRNRPHHVSDIWAESAHIPTDAAIRRASEILNQSKKPVIMAGRGAIGARQELEEIAELLGAPIVKPVLGKGLNENAIIATDSGTITTWVARHVQIRGDQMFSLSGNLATMACGLPYAIGAQIAYPGRQVVAFVGDGGLSMLMAELATAVKYQLPIKVVVIKNNTFGQIKWEQMVFLGNPEYVCDLQPIDFAMVARACGATGLSVERPEDCGRVMEQALATPGPVLVEAVVDPHEPPMPPKVKVEQALHFAESLARGTPHRGKIALTVASDTVRELV